MDSTQRQYHQFLINFVLQLTGLFDSEAAIPFKYFTEKGCDIDIVTEDGKGTLLMHTLESFTQHVSNIEPQCDTKMISGPLAAVLGAKQEAKQAYTQMAESTAFHSPKAWTAPEFSLLEYDVLILPGGHDKGVKQIIESESLRTHLRQFFPLTKGEMDGKKKVCGAIWCVS